MNWLSLFYKKFFFDFFRDFFVVSGHWILWFFLFGCCSAAKVNADNSYQSDASLPSVLHALSLTPTHTHAHRHTQKKSLFITHTHTHSISIFLSLSLKHTHTHTVYHSLSLTHTRTRTQTHTHTHRHNITGFSLAYQLLFFFPFLFVSDAELCGKGSSVGLIAELYFNSFQTSISKIYFILQSFTLHDWPS